MGQSQFTETATFVLRLALGAMFIAHSLYLKLFVFTLPGTAEFFQTIGLPGDFGVFADKPKTLAWRAALSARPSVRSAVAADYGHRLWRFLQLRPSRLAHLMAEAA